MDRNAANLQNIVDSALSRALDIESKSYKDAIDLIYRAQCSVEVALTDQLQRTLAETISNLIKSDPGIIVGRNFFGVRIDVNLKNIEIVDPDLAYGSTKRVYLSSMKTISADDPAILIVSKYSNISRFARFARCHYIDKPIGVIFMRDGKKYDALAQAWIDTVTLEPWN